MVTDPESSVKLCEEVLSQARRESEEIINRAKQNAETLLAEALVEARRARENGVEEAQKKAALASETILARVPVDAERMRVARVESLLESVHEEVLQRLLDHNGFEYREVLVTLAVNAMGAMAGDNFILKVSEQDRPLFNDGLAGEITQRLGRETFNMVLSYEENIRGGGVIVEDTAGRQICDNSLPARLDRMWPELRRLVAVQASLVTKTGSEESGP